DEADDDALSEPAGDGGGGSAAILPGRRRRAPRWLRPDGAAAAHGRDEREPSGDLRSRGTDAARELAREDAGVGQRRLEVLDRTPRRHARRLLDPRDRRRDSTLARGVP